MGFAAPLSPFGLADDILEKGVTHPKPQTNLDASHPSSRPEHSRAAAIAQSRDLARRGSEWGPG